MLRNRLLAMAMAISLTSQSFGMMSMAAELKEVPVAMVEDELVVEESTEEFSVKNELEVSTENLEIPTSSSEIHVASFEQEDIVVYEDSVFPDTVFRNYLKKEVGISEEEQLTNKHLEELTVVYMDAQNSTEKIGSLEGIQCCTNLQYLILSGHLFTDASQIENLKNLVTLELYNTELKKMPDLSRLVNLTYINLWENYIPEEEIISSKIPESFLEENPYWIEDTKSYQKEAFGIVVAPVYYANGSEHPFAIKVTGCNRYINYTLSAEINGITTEAHIEDYYSGAMVIPNLRGCEVSEDLQTVTVTLVDEYGKKWIDGESYSVIFAEDVEYPEDAYIGKNDTYAWLNVILSGTVTNTEGMVLQLWNAQGELVGQSESQLDAYKRYVDSRYEDTLGWIDLERNATEIDGNIQLKKLLSAGSYTLKLIDGEDVYEFENTVHVSDKAIIKETALSQYYASLGKYIYLYVSGYEIDSEKVWPVIYDEESGAALSKVTSVKTEFSDSGNIYNYKLEKLDSTDVTLLRAAPLSSS